MSTFCAGCGKELGFFSRKFKVPQGDVIQILCSDCHSAPVENTQTAPPVTAAPSSSHRHHSGGGSDSGRQSYSPAPESHRSGGVVEQPHHAPLTDRARYSQPTDRYASRLQVVNAGGQKIELIKILRDVTGLGLAECKDLARDGASVNLELSVEQAASLQDRLSALGVVFQLTTQMRPEDETSRLFRIVCHNLGEHWDIAALEISRALDLTREVVMPYFESGHGFVVRLTGRQHHALQQVLGKLGASVDVVLAGDSLPPDRVTALRIDSVGDNTLAVIKVIRAVTALGLKEAKDMAVPGGTCQVAGHHEKQQLLALFNSVGASVTLFSEPVSFPLLEAPDSEAVVTGDRFEVILTESGDHKISVIKELRAVTGLGLKESKHLADNGGTIATNVDSHAAKELVLTFTRLGARISLRPV